MTDLLPCPFCGSSDNLTIDFVYKEDWCVECDNCHVGQHALWPSKEHAIQKWNTRANKPAEVDLDALKRVVRGEKEGRYDMDYTYDLGWNAAIRAVQASGHLATGKGGGVCNCTCKLSDPKFHAQHCPVKKAEQQQPAAQTQEVVDKWEHLKISNGYQYPAQSGEYIVRMIDGAELRSQYDGRFFRRKDNWDKIIPDHEIVCFKAIRAALTQPRETVSTTRDYDLIAPVAHYFNGDAEKTRLWFETPNPNLGGVKPIDTPRDRLLKFITEQTLTQPTVDVEALKREVKAWRYPNGHSGVSDKEYVRVHLQDSYLINELARRGYLK